jgi:hypothetical protein
MKRDGDDFNGLLSSKAGHYFTIKHRGEDVEDERSSLLPGSRVLGLIMLDIKNNKGWQF